MSESLLADKFAMSHISPFPLFYFTEYNKIKLDVFELSKFYGDELDELISAYFDIRTKLKQEYFKNPNFLRIDHVEALP